METISDFYSIHISRQGFSHIEAEEEAKDSGRKFPCQDHSFSRVFNDGDGMPTFCFAAVSDGHGSAPHFRSGEGAEFAVQIMLECVKAHLKRIIELQSRSEINSELKILTSEICVKWKSLVLADIQKKPITDTEYKYLSQEAGYEKYVEQYKNGVELENVYGCTALSVVNVPTKKLWFAFQIGDGDIVIKKKGGIDYEKPIPDDDAVGSETFSLCDKNASGLFKWNFAQNEEISAAFCSSDGIFNSFNSDKGLFNFYNTVIEQFCYSDRGDEENTNINLRVKNLTSELENYLDDLSRKASHDDMSVSGFLEITSERILGHKNSEKLIADGKWYLKQAESDADVNSKIKKYDSLIKKFQEAAKNGLPESYMLGGIALFQKAKLEGKNEWTTVQALFQRAINGGYLEAKKILGRFQCQEAKEKLKEKKFSEALELLTKSSENDFSEASFYLSKIYKNPQNYSRCTKENVQKSFNYLKKAATDGFAIAEFEIAKCYAKGSPIPANSEAAAEYFEKVLKQVRENSALETEDFSKMTVLKELAKFYAKSSPKKAIDLCNEAIAIDSEDDEAKSIRKTILQNQPLQKSVFGKLFEKKSNENATDLADKKQEVFQLASELKPKQILKKAQQTKGQQLNNSLVQNHVKTTETKTQQSLSVAASSSQAIQSKPNNTQKLPTAEQLEKADKDLHRRIINAIQELTNLVEKSKITEGEVVRDNLYRLEKELNTSELDKNKKAALVIKAQNFLNQADDIIGKTHTSVKIITVHRNTETNNHTSHVKKV